jgi:hypothetical protein
MKKKGGEYSRMVHREFGREFWGLDVGRTGDNGVINETEYLKRRSSVSKRDLATGQHVIIDSHCEVKT